MNIFYKNKILYNLLLAEINIPIISIQQEEFTVGLPPSALAIHPTLPILATGSTDDNAYLLRFNLDLRG
jgi:hypothetical protein